VPGEVGGPRSKKNRTTRTTRTPMIPKNKRIVIVSWGDWSGVRWNTESVPVGVCVESVSVVANVVRNFQGIGATKKINKMKNNLPPQSTWNRASIV
jgi:hypothetical protein